MINRRALDVLAGACYDAALGHADWNSVMHAIGAAFHGTHVTLLQQGKSGTARVMAASGFEASVLAAYESYYKDHNILLKRVHQPENAHLWRVGVVRASEMFCPDDVLMRSEYYNDFLRPISVRRLVSTTLCERAAVQISVWQERSQSQAERRHFRAMAYLATHLRRALQVHDRLGEANAFRSVLEDYLARISRGAALLDAAGAVMYVNDVLHRIVAARDGLSIQRSRLSAQNAAVQKALNAAVARALSGGTGGRIAIPRPSSSAPYQVLVSPLGHQAGMLSARRGALVLISDPACGVDFDRSWLQDVYGLTQAECTVACHLANGNSLEQLALHLGVTMGTVRTHLKRVLHKTHTHRQADLVRLLLLSRTTP